MQLSDGLIPTEQGTHALARQYTTQLPVLTCTVVSLPVGLFCVL
jgi:hypothetical protein